MSIEKEAAKIGLKVGKKGLKAMIEPVRQWLTRWAWRGRTERLGKTLPLLLVALILSGCASMKAAVQDALIVADEKAFGGGQNPGIGRVPDGHIVVKFPRDQQGNRVYMDGWTWDWEMVKKEGYVAPPYSLQEPQAKSLFEQVLELKALADSGTKDAPKAAAGLSDIEKLITDEAAKEGVK